jgi:hypothetical protein
MTKEFLDTRTVACAILMAGLHAARLRKGQGVDRLCLTGPSRC